MKKQILILLSLFSTLTFSGDKVYQVITQDPHHVEKFERHIQTVSNTGRLWLVTLDDNAPSSILKYFKEIKDPAQVNTYFPLVFKSEFRFYQDWIRDVVNKVDVDAIEKSVEHLSNYENRAVGKEGNKQATIWLENQFKALGYQTSLFCYKPDACSVMAEKIGSQFPSEVILTEAHFDSVGKIKAGADDNGSGTAALLEMARVLSTQNLKRTVRFFATNGEEVNLLGAEHYVKQLSSSDLKNFKLVINMDMVGYNANGVVELETDKQFENLANWFAQLTSDYTTLTSKITLGAWGSDHVPFLRKNIPTLLTIEDWSTKTPCYHGSCDKPDTLNYVYAGEITKLNIAAILTKDQM